MQEDCEEFISLTLRTIGSKKPLRTQEENWKHQWFPRCFARHARKTSMVRPVARLMISSLNLRVSWNPVKPQECVWDKTKVSNKSEVIDEARTKGIKVHFSSLMDICHLKNAELETKHQKYNGRVVLRGDIVKDDSGSYTVFTEQGTSASQMTAAKVMDIKSRLPGCSGQAADAVSSCTQVKMEDAPKLFKIPKWIRLPRHKWPTSWSSMEDPVVPLERNLYGHPLAGLLWERQFGTLLGKGSKLGMLIRTP